MPWPVHPNGLLGASGDNDTYQVSRSLRFNSTDLTYLSRTPASITNQKTYTFNFWAKRSVLGTDQSMFSALFASTALRYAYIAFDTSDRLVVFSGIYSLGGTTTASYEYTTTQVFRDTSAWYMITVAVDTTNATASDRVKIYVNGVQVTSFSTATQPALNQNGYWNSTQFHGIGTFNSSIQFFNGYLAEINFIDGQVFEPSSFGETDALTGRWKAKAYSGTYGTNGYYLKFADNSGTTATTLGKDSSSNANNWTPNNLSVTSGPGNDSLLDSPTNYGSGTATVGNFCTWNALINGDSSDNGNLDVTNDTARGNHELMKYDAYWEVTSTGGTCLAGIVSTTATSTITVGSSKTFGFKLSEAGIFEYANITDGSSFTSQATATTLPFPYASTGASITASINCGQRAFAGTLPAGYKPICTTSFDNPTIQKPSKYMDALAYTGTGASNSISSFGFSPDLVWIKNRGATTSHAIYDTVRLATKQISSDTTGDEATSSTGLTSFNSNGFTLGASTLVNTSGTQYVAWAWDDAPICGVDVISYTGNGANRTISHALGVAPKMLIVKARTTAGADQGWPVWHTSIANTTYMTLNTTSATATGADYWNSTSPTSSVFSLGNNVAVNANNDTYIAYAFAGVEGFSKFGSYIGNASADGAFAWCGFRPSFIMIKSSTAADAWLIYDNKRNTFNVASTNLVPNTNAADATISGIDFLSNGFKLRTITTTPNAAQTYIFAAFAESPFKYARAR